MNGTGPPAELVALDQWVNWNPRKVPTPPINGELLTYVEARRRNHDAVGFVFTTDDPFAGIDIDAMTPLAQRMLSWARELGAFYQRSPSGRGWHIIGLGSLPRGIGKGKLDRGVEAYSEGRYFTMPPGGSGSVMVSIQPLLDELWTLTQAGDHAQPGEHIDWDPERHAQLLEAVSADCDRPTWVAVGMALHSAGAPATVFETWSSTATGLGSDGKPRYQGPEDCARVWGSFREGATTLGTLYKLAREAGWSETATPADFEDLTVDGEQPKNPFLEALVDAGTLTGPPPARVWTWDQWIPEGVVTGLAGPPGTAKSTFALQLAVHLALGVPFLGHEMATGPALFATVEDDLDELHRRVHRMCDSLMADVSELLTRLQLLPAAEMDTTLVAATDEGLKRRMPTATHFEAMIEVVKPKLVVLDLVGDFWEGSENVRAQVSPYIRRYLGKLAQRHAFGVVAISHPSVAGMREGRPFAGSTAVEGSYRSGLSLTRPDEQHADELMLRREKANYASLDERMLLWDAGYLRSIEGTAAEQRQLDRVCEAIERGGQDGWCRVQAYRDEMLATFEVRRGEADAMLREAVRAEVVEEGRVPDAHRHMHRAYRVNQCMR